MKKKILFVGPYYQQDEWGNNAKGMIDILSSIDNIELTTRPIWLSNQMSIDKEDEIKYENFENDYHAEYDVLIQNCLPQYFIKSGIAKSNVLYTSIDSFIDHSSWSANIGLADSIIVCSELEKQIISKVATDQQNIFNINTVPYFKQKCAKQMDFDFYQKKFLIVSGANPMHGIYEAVISYLSSFNMYDNTILIIATSDDKAIMEQIKIIKAKLGIYQNQKLYPNIAVFSTSNNEIIEFLHQNCDFYIDVGYNSKLSQGSLASIFAGKLPILLDINKNSVGENYPFLVDSSKEICMNDQKPFIEMYTGEYYWHMPNTLSLKEILRAAYHNEERNSIAKKIVAEYKESYLANLKQKISEAIGCLQ